MGLGKDTIPLSEYVAASGSASLIRNRYTPDFCFVALSWADATFPGLLGKFVIIISEFEHPPPRLSIAHPIGECSYLRSPVAPVTRIVQKPSRHHVTLFGPDGSRSQGFVTLMRQPCRSLRSTIPFEDIGPPMTAILTSLYVSTIILVGAFLFRAVERLEPNHRLAIVLKCAILAAGGAAIAKQLWP